MTVDPKDKLVDSRFRGNDAYGNDQLACWHRQLEPEFIPAIQQ